MPYNEDTYVYDPLDRQTFEAIAYNAYLSRLQADAQQWPVRLVGRLHAVGLRPAGPWAQGS